MSTFDDSKIDLEVYVVIPAAGCGVRFGSLPPKQLQLLGNQPLICRTVSAFESIPWISQIIVPTSADLIDHLTAIFHDHGFLKVKTCLGSATRHRSIFNGIIALEKVCSADSVVIIHDAVRPFVNQSTVASVTMAAHLHKAAGVTRPLVSTVISCDDHSLLKESLDRNRYQASEMPQAFQYNVIRSAYENCCTHDFDHGTECLHLALKYCDVRAKLIEGSEHLWKVTYRRDLLAAEMTLRDLYSKVHVCTPHDLPTESLTACQKHFQNISISHSLEEVSLASDSGGVLYIAQKPEEITGIFTDIKNRDDLCSLLRRNAGAVVVVQLGYHGNNIQGIRRCVHDNAVSLPDVVVNAVCEGKNCELDDLFGLTHSLFTQRNMAFTGQTLISGVE